MNPVTFINRAAQGDLYIRRVDSVPDGLRMAKAEAGAFIVAHSETGHHHIIEASPRVAIYETDDPLVAYLRVIEATDEAEAVILRHQRSFDTHAPIAIPPGVYELRRQREYTPEGWRRAQD